MADRYNMFSNSRPLPGWNPQSANKDGEYYDKGKLATIPGSITPPLRDNVFSAEELGISNNTVTQSAPVSGYVNTGDYNKDINNYLSGFADPDEEDKLRKQSRNRMAIMAVGDAIRQLGNIYHTSRYAPSQKFNNPVENEYGRYYTQKKLREADAYKKYTMRLQRDKLEAEQKQREFQNQLKLKEHDYKLAKDKQAQENWQKTFEANQKQRDLTNELNQKKFENQKAYQEASLKLRKETADRAHARGMASLNETRRYHNYLMNKGSGGVVGTNGKRETVYSPTSGASYSFPKGTFTGVKGKANIQALYNQMEKAGLFDGKSLLTGIQRQLAESGSLYIPTDLSDDDKLALVLDAAGRTERGHAMFVYGARRLGYQYEGGMSEESKKKLVREPVKKAAPVNKKPSEVKSTTTVTPPKEKKDTVQKKATPVAQPKKVETVKPKSNSTPSGAKRKKSYDNTNNLLKSWQ